MQEQFGARATGFREVRSGDEVPTPRKPRPETLAEVKIVVANLNEDAPTVRNNSFETTSRSRR